MFHPLTYLATEILYANFLLYVFGGGSDLIESDRCGEQVWKEG
jgi:hypothetical protein